MTNQSLLEDFKNHLTFERQLSPNTTASYGSDVEHFLEYCIANEKDLYQAQLDIFLDPNDPAVIAQALKVEI